jgi:translation initiation factor IF-1
MSKDDYITLEGSVIDVLPGNQYRVKLQSNDHTILAYLSGKMKKNRIRVIEGDRVDVEIGAYDVSKGRISYRYK